MSTIVQAHTAVAFRAPPETLVIAATEDERNHWEEEQHQQKQGVFANNLGGFSRHETCFLSCRPRSDSHTGPLLRSILPSTQTALLVTLDRTYCLEPEFPAPENIGTDEVIIRSKAVGLNHIDWKSVEFNFCLPDLPWITGREMAGVVERVGSNVTNLKRGDAVWTCK